MNNQVKLIDADKLLKWLEEKRTIPEGKKYRALIELLELQIEIGDFDPDTPLVPTIKPGDKVRITDAMDRHYIGKEDIVTRISGSSPYSARLNDSPGDWPFSSLEVVE